MEERHLEQKDSKFSEKRGGGVSHGRSTLHREVNDVTDLFVCRWQQGANKWRQGLFDSRLETKGGDKMELESVSGTHLYNIAPPEKWEKVATGQWI